MHSGRDLKPAANDKLPTLVCGRSVTVRQLQDQVYGTATPNPW